MAPSVASLDEFDDATLVARIGDDPELFGVLFRRYAHDVHRFVWRRCRDDALADDLTAATFERAWRALPGFRLRHPTIRPWLLHIAANTAASHFRSETRRRDREHLVAVRDEPVRTSTSPTQVVDGHDPELLDALGDLSERHQEVLTLRYLADLSTAEAAEAMQITRGHLAVLQHRALAALRSAMKESTHEE